MILSGIKWSRLGIPNPKAIHAHFFGEERERDTGAAAALATLAEPSVALARCCSCPSLLVPP
jgi:hypothetical protein